MRKNVFLLKMNRALLGLASIILFPQLAAAQDAAGIINLFGGIVQGAIAEAARSEWRNAPATDITCLESKGYGIVNLVSRGIGPNDPGIRRVVIECRREHRKNLEQSEAMRKTSPGDNPGYAIDGLGLGDPVHPESAAYKEYRCNASEQFPSYIWCRKSQEEKGKFGFHTKTTSILHSETNLSAAYVSRSIVPAYFHADDIEHEIDRLSQLFESRPRIINAPARAGIAGGIIAVWGALTLEPIDAESIAILASGQSVRKGMLIDFLGSFSRSAREGMPVYQIGGGPGYIYCASHDENGRGHLRLTISDSSVLDRSFDEIAREKREEENALEASIDRKRALEIQNEQERAQKEGDRQQAERLAEIQRKAAEELRNAEEKERDRQHVERQAEIERKAAKELRNAEEKETNRHLREARDHGFTSYEAYQEYLDKEKRLNEAGISLKSTEVK